MMSHCVTNYNANRLPNLRLPTQLLTRCGYAGADVLPFCGMSPSTFSPIQSTMNATCCFSCRACNSDAMSKCSQAIPFCNSSKVSSFKGCCPV